MYEKNLPLVKQNLEQKQNQSNIAKKRKAEEEAQQQQAQASSARAPLVLPLSSVQILQQTPHLEPVIRREQFTPWHPAQGNLMLEVILYVELQP